MIDKVNAIYITYGKQDDLVESKLLNDSATGMLLFTVDAFNRAYRHLSCPMSIKGIANFTSFVEYNPVTNSTQIYNTIGLSTLKHMSFYEQLSKLTD